MKTVLVRLLAYLLSTVISFLVYYYVLGQFLRSGSFGGGYDTRLWAPTGPNGLAAGPALFAIIVLLAALFTADRVCRAVLPTARTVEHTDHL